MSIWEVEYTHEFEEWYESLSEVQQDAVISRVEVLESTGPGLGRPTVDNVHQSKHSNMKELRCEGAIRVMFAFDPRRMAILLIGGDKSPDDPGTPNWNRWYDHYTPIADDLYDTHLEELRREGLI
ncbi:MAG: type II toxin-antitoxin system RelE/ParE family toxin [Acidimicrobiales bacterium]